MTGPQETEVASALLRGILNKDTWAHAVGFYRSLQRELELKLDQAQLESAFIQDSNPRVSSPDTQIVFTWENRLGSADEVAFMRCFFAAVDSLPNACKKRLGGFLVTAPQDRPFILNCIKIAQNESLRLRDPEIYQNAQYLVYSYFTALEFVSRKLSLPLENFALITSRLPIIGKNADLLTDDKYGRFRETLIPKSTGS